MDILNKDQIHELIEHRSPHCISLYMPTHRAGREQQQDTIRLKNLLRQARAEMLEKTESTTTVDAVLQPAIDLRMNELFWRNRSDGLACFCAPQFFRAYRVPLRLEERLFVNDHFLSRPLLPLLRSDARLYVLALTQEAAALYESTRYSIREVALPDVAPLELEGEKPTLQYYSYQAPTQGRGETDSAMFHGHGGPADRSKADTLRFFQLVDRAVAQVLRGQDAPLVLACVGYLAPLYESANSYRNLFHGKVPGNPDRWSVDELRLHAWKLVAPDVERRDREAWHEFELASGKGRASDELSRVVLAADEGRVDKLFLAQGEERWGHVDADLQAVQTLSDKRQGVELLDYAAARTLKNGGSVLLLDSLPDVNSPIAATFRY